MDTELYRRGRKLVAEPPQLEKWLNEAEKQADTVPSHFNGLVAAMIEQGGLHCEQECCTNRSSRTCTAGWPN
jgi:hypothetical protein